MRTMLVALLFTALALALGSCGPGSTRPEQPSVDRPAAPLSAAAVRDAGAAPHTGVAGTVLAHAEGEQGLIQVAQQGSIRRLLIDGVVHGEKHMGDTLPEAADPLVVLLRSLRPQARRALVIGLGTGKTADDLAAGYMHVLALELEHGVIDFARRYFGYRGHAMAVDGLTYLERRDADRFDIVVMDAFAGRRPASKLVTPHALGLMMSRTTHDGLLAVRTLGKPSEPAVRSIVEALRSSAPGVDVKVHGSGVGAEEQNLYLVAERRHAPSPTPCTASTSSLNASAAPTVDRTAIPPLVSPWDGPCPDEPQRTTAEPPARALRLVGYLVRLREDGALALDLPHREMGASRYLLTGSKAAELARKLPAQLNFPTSGDIGSDGDTSRTLEELLGGGGVKRSDVRFSPVAVAVSGEARHLAQVSPNLVFGGRPIRRPRLRVDSSALDPRLPYGGQLYELEVSQVHWVLDFASWRRLKRQLAAHLAPATAALRQGSLQQAISPLQRYLALAKQEQLAELSLVRSMTRALTKIRTEASALGGSRGPYPRAVACDRIRSRPHDPPWTPKGSHVRVLDDALVACAERHYRAVTQAGGPEVELAASRLLAVLEDQRFEVMLQTDDERATRPIERQIEALQKRFPGITARSDPPPRRLGSPPAKKRPPGK
ncbi:MAG: hypothetical protein JRI23_08885 [Deltaproteobacteria bacterium]|nr:hypothetical protein [Deltaproteobacteria bacterium]